mmetsp:Transcript_63598/g.165154  ORF Transcript_63598/g.165154 Transcript_63598/m.165154 type:complete len:269 (+) Transcript_63598:753-1559(+)
MDVIAPQCYEFLHGGAKILHDQKAQLVCPLFDVVGLVVNASLESQGLRAIASRHDAQDDEMRVGQSARRREMLTQRVLLRQELEARLPGLALVQHEKGKVLTRNIEKVLGFVPQILTRVVPRHAQAERTGQLVMAPEAIQLNEVPLQQQADLYAHVLLETRPFPLFGKARLTDAASNHPLVLLLYVVEQRRCQDLLEEVRAHVGEHVRVVDARGRGWLSVVQLVRRHVEVVLYEKVFSTVVVLDRRMLTTKCDLLVVELDPTTGSVAA